MTDADIKNAIKSIAIHHELGWWVASMPDIGVVTQARTLPELGVEIERIVIAHFAVNAEVGTDPFRCKQLPLSEELAETLRVVLKTRGATYASIASSLREIERRLRATAQATATVFGSDARSAESRLLCAEVAAAASAVAAVAALVETPLTTEVTGSADRVR